MYGSLDLSTIVPKYQITNNPSLLTITSSLAPKVRNYTVTFAGCDNTLGHPFTFDSTSGVYLGSIPDSAGGKTQYWSLNTTALYYVDGQAFTNVPLIGSLGIVEVYKSP